VLDTPFSGHRNRHFRGGFCYKSEFCGL
jgi:hypothetical protein